MPTSTNKNIKDYNLRQSVDHKNVFDNCTGGQGDVL